MGLRSFWRLQWLSSFGKLPPPLPRLFYFSGCLAHNHLRLGVTFLALLLEVVTALSSCGVVTIIICCSAFHY